MLSRRPASFGHVLAAKGGVGPGFDFLRIALALAVVAWHAPTAVGFTGADETRFVWFPGYGILVMFFALSGFLISASALRLRLSDFLINRALRIVPALLVEVVLSAFLLGALFTTLPVHDYVRDPGVWRYLTNVLGIINYRLPGVFESHPDPAVNTSLWTIPFEIGCYVVISAFVLLGALRRPGLVLAAFLLFTGIGLAIGALAPLPSSGRLAYVAHHVFTDRGSRLFAAFLLGIVAYLWRHRIPYRRDLALVCVGLCILASTLEPAPWLSLPLLNLLVAPALVYLTVFIGVSDIPPLPLFDRGDYSYGVYLYGFPIQQALVSLLPGAHAATNFALATPAIVLFAMMSWHLVEKPVLKQRRRFSFIAQTRLAASREAVPVPQPGG